MKNTRASILLVALGSFGCGGGASEVAQPSLSMDRSKSALAAAPPAPGATAGKDTGVSLANVREDSADGAAGAGKTTLATTPPSQAPRANPPGDAKPKGTKSEEKNDPSPMSATTTGSAGHYSEDDVSSLIAPHLGHLRRCASIDATVSVRLSIAAGGQIVSAVATRSAPDDAQLRDCVATVFKELSFTKVDGGGSTLAFDLSLKPLARP